MLRFGNKRNVLYLIMLCCLVGAVYFTGYNVGYLNTSQNWAPTRLETTQQATPAKFIHINELKPVPVTPTKTPKKLVLHVTQVDPMALDIPHRFDIIIKTVYVMFLRRGKVPTFVKNMYIRHEKVWNGFNEACNVDDDWFDKKNPCNEGLAARLW